MGERTPEEYVAACEKQCVCPLGAALRGKHPEDQHWPPNPTEGYAEHYLKIGRPVVGSVVIAWDGWGDGENTPRAAADRPQSVRLALAAGLGPLMDAYLFPPSPSASRQERGGSEGSEGSAT